MKTVGPGARLGPYEIVSRIGAGGMGEVWRASDTRLDRHVAIKILPAELARDAKLQVRFEREARAVSRLNHANICTLHDIGSEDGVSYLVMELLEGESLADRLAKGPLAPSEVLRYGAQIAEALSVAHRAGIVHRDLKPGNVMITKSGAKLLDFGLARTATTAVQMSDPDDPTVAAAKPLTAEGTIVGTFQYMAPEQLEGLEADVRTDIFALGAVLYEMTTGRRAFSGSTRTSLIASIVGADPPPLRSLQPLASPVLEHIISKALAKDPEERWQSAQDVAAELRWAGSSQVPSDSALPAPTVARRRRHERVLLALLVLAIAAVAAMALLHRQAAQRADRVLITDLGPPQDMELDNAGDTAAPAALSPDGRHVVFGVQSKGQRTLWVRTIETGEMKPLTGTEEATFPFWCDDNRGIAFFSGGSLKRTEIGGGAPVVLAQAAAARGGTWRGDTIIFTPTGLSALVRLSASGGTPTPATQLDRALHTSHRWPSLLPDGKHFLYLAGNHQDGSGGSNAVYLGSLEGGAPKLLLKTTSSAAWTDGYLLTVRDTNLVAQKMTMDGTISGEPRVVASGVFNDLGTWRSAFSASDRGDLLFGTGRTGLQSAVEWVDRTGKTLEVVLEGERFWDARLSPDYRKLAVGLGDPNRQLWLYDMERKTRTRLDFGAKWAGLPSWTPDSSTIIANTIRGSGFSIMAKRLDGSSPRELFKSGESGLGFGGLGTTVAADGKTWIFASEGSLWRASLDVPDRAARLTPPEWRAKEPHHSPDGRWLVYVCTQQGRDEVYIASAENPAEKTPVSQAGGSRPAWRADSRELYYVDGSQMLTAVPVNADATLGEPVRLFPFKSASIDFPYSASADGQRFLMVRIFGNASVPVRLMTNWQRALK